ANGDLPGTLICARFVRGSHRGGAPTTKLKPAPNPKEHPPRVRMGPAQDANLYPARPRFAPEAVLLQKKTKTYPDPVGAPAPGANGCLPAPYPVIGKPGPFHKLGVPDISTIQQQRLVHLRMQTLEVRAPIGLPLGHQHQR